MNTNTPTTVKVVKADVTAMRRLLDGIVGRSLAQLKEDVAAARTLVEIAAKYECSTRDLADVLDRSQTEVSRTLRAGKASDSDVKRYLAGNPRQVSLSGLVTFLATGGATPVATTPLERLTASLSKLETAEECDAAIAAAKARKRELAKAALKAA